MIDNKILDAILCPLPAEASITMRLGAYRLTAQGYAKYAAKIKALRVLS